jgi:hypothetical protein
MTTTGRRWASNAFLQHEAGLGHGALEGIDQQQATVGHLEHPFDLAAEIGVSGRVDQVDLGVVVLDGDVLGEDGDAAFAFQGVGIEDAFALELGVAKLAALPQHLVHEGGLAMIDVGDHGDVAYLLVSHRLSACGPRVSPLSAWYRVFVSPG